MSKIVLIKRASKSDWISCQSITSNIEKAYSELVSQDDLFTYYLNPEDDQYTQWKLALKLKQLKPDVVAFVDHMPHPQSLIRSMREVFSKLPKFIFHIFGDFTLQTSEWLSLQDILKESSAEFIVASQKQKALLQNLMQGSDQLIDVIAFPINSEVFKFKQRASEKAVTYLYTGRISTQKNVLELITYFNQFNSKIAPTSKLVIAGPIDDLGIPFLGKTLHSGSYANSIEKQLAALNNPNISMLRNCSHQRLVELYSKADYYISLSTHNDEDYGMSPAEALSCGLPCILTDWGGFSGFKDFSSTRMIPVVEKNNRILPHVEKLILELTDAQNEVASNEERKKISEAAKESLSITSYSSNLKKHLEVGSKVFFKAFTNEMSMMASSHRIYKNAPFFKGANGSYSNLYKKIYAPYFN